MYQLNSSSIIKVRLTDLAFVKLSTSNHLAHCPSSKMVVAVRNIKKKTFSVAIKQVNKIITV